MVFKWVSTDPMLTSVLSEFFSSLVPLRYKWSGSVSVIPIENHLGKNMSSGYLMEASIKQKVGKIW